jgi:photosystem II stability/assembly factor-like uncharacterized protein
VHIHFYDSLKGISTGQAGVILKTTNGGINWLSQTSTTTQELSGCFMVDSNIGYAVGFSGTILKTTDGGQQWIQQASGTTSNLRSVSFSDNNIGYAVGYNGVILKTTNGGTTWLPQSSGTTNNLFSVCFISAEIGTAVGTSKILRTINGGEMWITQSVTFTGDLYDVDFVNPQLGWTVGQQGKIFYTNTPVNVLNEQYDQLTTFILNQNYPNPFNPTTKIKFVTPSVIASETKQSQPVTLNIYDVLGNEITTLVNEELPAGEYEIEFDATGLPSGIYFYQLKAETFSQTNKMIYLK